MLLGSGLLGEDREVSCLSCLRGGFPQRDWWGESRTVCTAVVEEDVCVRMGSGLILCVGFGDCDFVLVALAGA